MYGLDKQKRSVSLRCVLIFLSKPRCVTQTKQLSLSTFRIVYEGQNDISEQ